MQVDNISIFCFVLFLCVTGGWGDNYHKSGLFETCHIKKISVDYHHRILIAPPNNELFLKKVWSSRIFCRRTYKYRISYKSFHFRCNSIKDLNFRIHSFTACFKLINNQISLSFKNILTSFSSSISFLLLLYWDGLTNLAKVIIVTPLSVLDPSASAGVDAAWSFLLVMGIIMAS